MFAAVLGMITRAGAPILVNWFGNGHISVSGVVFLFLSCCVAVTIFQSVLEKVALATFDELRAAIKSLATGSIVGLPLVGVGASQFGVAGALGGVLIGLLAVVAFELFAYAKVTCSRSPGRRD
jgi:O-antigen/teichoic acid export membrane protein